MLVALVPFLAAFFTVLIIENAKTEDSGYTDKFKNI
jgi:hypothetical protein